MQALSAQTILQLWEIGQSQHPIDRALTLLNFACPDRSPEDLAHLSIGQRDLLLLTLRELTFSSQLVGTADCPQCGERLEFVMSTADLRTAEPHPEFCRQNTEPTELSLTLEDFELQVTLPNSRDLAAIAHCPDLETARTLLMQRCLRQIKQSGTCLEATALPPALLSQVADRLAAADPQAEIWLDFNCPACQHQWKLLFDIVQFFWTELSSQAQRLMREVHTLARFYGWREADILSMSNLRRQAYLELAG
jgi:hypothetical protein